MESTINIGDNLLSVLELNKQKLNILTKLSILEWENKVESQEYIDNINIYKIICEILRKKLFNQSAETKQKSMKAIFDLNYEKEKFIKADIIALLESTNQELVLFKTLIDFGLPVMQLYDSKIISNANSKIQHIMNMIGLSFLESDEYEQKINKNLINEYMISDFANVMLNVVEKEIEKSNHLLLKQELYVLKYHLIFVFESLEDRVLLTNFLIPNTPHLVDEVSIRVAGMTLDDYNKCYDTKIASILESNILYFRHKISYYYGTLTLLPKICMQTFANLLTDKELLDVLRIEELENTNLTIGVIEELHKINNLIDIAQNTDYQKIRKYPNI